MPIWKWGGLVLFAIGGWLLVTALQRRRRALTVWQAAQAKGQPVEVHIGPKFLAVGIVIRLLAYSMLMAVAGGAIMFYQAAGDASLAADVNLAGLLFLLLGYGVWVSVRTRYRDLSPVMLSDRPN